MSPKENTIEKVNKVRQDLGLPVPNYRGTTGSAADIGVPTGFAAETTNIDDNLNNNEIEMIKEIYDYIQNNNKIPHIKMYDDIWWDTKFLISPLSYGKPTMEQLKNLYEICGYANKLHNMYYKDKKLTIHSGLRVKAYNDYIRQSNPYAAKYSSHIYGKALDFDIEGVSTDELRVKIVGSGFKGMKKSYSNWIHIDLRPSQRGYSNDW